MTSIADDSQSRTDMGIDLCHFRSDEVISRQQQKFVAIFADAPGPVLDVGCGRGVMLKLLREAGIESYGIDSFEPALDICREQRLQVVNSDLFAHLRNLSDGSLGGIFCCHVIEHLLPSQALTLIRESHRVLHKGGRLVLVTPNSRDLLVWMESFWMDMTHVRFYPARLLEILLRQTEFTSIRSFEDKDTRGFSPKLYRRLAQRLRRLWFWGLVNRGDVVVIATR